MRAPSSKRLWIWLLTITLVVWPAGFIGSAVARSGDGQDGARTLLGSYLAGRIARGQHDTAAASEYYRQALLRDPGNDALIEQSLLMDATEGRFEQAVALAQQLLGKQQNHQMARLVVGLSEAKQRRFAGAQKYFRGTGGGLMGELTGALALAWILQAEGDLKSGMDILDAVRPAEWAQFYIRFHKALIYDVAGRRQDARAMYERTFKADPKSLRVALAYARHAAASGDAKLARSIIEEHGRKAQGNLHPVARTLLDQIKAGDKVSLQVEDTVAGLSEVFYGLGEALSSEGGTSIGAVYLQLALFLQPDFPFALAALANVYETTKRYSAAVETYDRIPKGTPLQSAVDIRKALNLNQLERVEEAKTLLEELAQADATDLRPLDALGNIMRGHKRYQEAVEYYTRAIALIGTKPDKKYWAQFYARGTCYERIKKWPQAEADLQKAMQLAPDQPLVLNYLGYSWVDQNRNLKQGLTLIERAVQLKPDDGYIVDSLGWAHYRLGNYKDAVKYLERAVELRAEDPVLNDHLGDAFWRVGREVEARYQWEQALTLKPEAEDAEKIKRKLTKGLPARPQARGPKRAKEAGRIEVPKKRSEIKAAPARPIVE